jgi:hypothetical protein
MFIVLTSTTTPPGRKEVPSISRSLYRSEFALLQFSTEHGQMLGVAMPADSFWRFFILSIYCPFRTGNWLYSVERIEAGETVDSKSRQ